MAREIGGAAYFKDFVVGDVVYYHLWDEESRERSSYRVVAIITEFMKAFKTEYDTVPYNYGINSFEDGDWRYLRLGKSPLNRKTGYARWFNGLSKETIND
jgi:hypothetical protein